MATFDAIFVPAEDSTGTVNATSSSTEIAVGSYKKFAINANGDINLAFGVTGMGAATASNFRLPSGVVAIYDMGRNLTHIRIYNPGGSTITYWLQNLTN